MKSWKKIIPAIVISLMVILSVLPASAYMLPGIDSSNGAKNILLVYTGYYNPANYNDEEIGVWDKNKFMPYVAHLDENGKPDDFFFDTFLFLGISTPYGGNMGRYYSFVSGHPGQMRDWQWFLDRVFTKNQQLEALNQAVEEANQQLNQEDHKVLVYMMLPFPDPQSTDFGDIDNSGTSLNLSLLDDRKKAIKWYIGQFINRFNEANYKYLKLGGFYWMQEDLDTNVPGEVESVRYTSDYLHELGLKLGWIPWAGAELKAEGNKYGFDWTIIQPNHYFNEGSTYETIKNTAKLADSSNEGVEIEFDQRVLTDQWHRQALTDYLVGGVEFGYMKNSLLAYYQDVYGLYEIYNSKDPIGKQIYNDIYYFSKGEYKLPEAGTGNIKGRILDMEGKPIQGIQISNGDKVVTTDSGGNYEFDGLYACVQNFSVKDVTNKVYKPVQFSVSIKAGYTIYKDIILEKGILYGKVGGTVDNSVYSNISAGIIPIISMAPGGSTDELNRERGLMSRLTDGIYGNGDWDAQRDHYVDFYRNTARDLYID
ncbi:MAG: DUF4855 domain-containing protein, partial [Thermoanaerobacterium sp.]|nr:DUF4855 domain-containing protein [Thermoanaerobacterium sp.]